MFHHFFMVYESFCSVSVFVEFVAKKPSNGLEFQKNIMNLKLSDYFLCVSNNFGSPSTYEKYYFSTLVQLFHSDRLSLSLFIIIVHSFCSLSLFILVVHYCCSFLFFIIIIVDSFDELQLVLKKSTFRKLI